MKIPKKSLSQNFIKDKNICKKIVKLTKIRNKTIVEIGPGYGFLTDVILSEKPKLLYLIEKDNALSNYLKNKYKNNKSIIILNQDILHVNFDKFTDINIISNLPYNVGTKVILKLFKYSSKINEMIFMIQKEVAEKFDYNKFKLNKYKFLNKLISNYKVCFKVPPTVFYPKPKIDSMIVKFKLKKKIIDWEKAEKFCLKIFKNKRKKINNNIEISKSNLKNIKNKRVDEISINQLINIYYSF